ncbi:hypothetical protein [Corynebacterium terpenotabidum]|uniref:hypothetical protein n=1 Tax=Corynebacterium terpenotabidum TaxID=89154 RepID=UPI001FE1A837|nr:hypothetical protein [Corynebacterium terpenotabidum]
MLSPPSPAQTTLTLTRPGRVQASTLRRIAAVTTRVLRMDPGAMARFVSVGADATDVLLSTPLGCVVAQRLAAVISEDGAVVSADPLPALLGEVASSAQDATLTLGSRMDLMWPGTPPPASGWTVVDVVPGADVRDLFASFQAEAEAHSGPAGLPPSLLDQPLLRLTSRTQTGIIEIPGSVIAALGSLGLVKEPPAELVEHDRVRVSITGSWIRVDALFGTVYLPRPGGLARIPTAR